MRALFDVGHICDVPRVSFRGKSRPRTDIAATTVRDPNRNQHQIRRLEEQLGKRLFVRRSRSLVLTREAQDYLPAIRHGRVDDRLAPQPVIPAATGHSHSPDGPARTPSSALSYRTSATANFG